MGCSIQHKEHKRTWERGFINQQLFLQIKLTMLKVFLHCLTLL